MEEVTQEQTGTRYDGLRTTENTLAILLDTGQIIQDIKNSLLGREYVKDELGEGWRSTRKPLMTEDGVFDYMRLLDSFIGIPQQLTKITGKEKSELLRRILYTTIEFIYFNKDKYKIDEASYSMIYTIVRVNMNLFLNKSETQTLIQFIRSIFGSRETIQKRGDSREFNDEKPKGFFFGGKR